MNLANKITIFRIFLIIPILVLFFTFIWYVKYYLKIDFNQVDTNNSAQYFLYAIGALFIISMITDFIDGYIARKRNTITTFGKLFDPLADKIIISITLIFLACFDYVYIILVVLFIIRDLIVDGSRNIAASHNLKIEASIYGKLKTLLQSIAIPIVIFLIPIINQEQWWHLFLLNLPLILATIASLYSGFLYFKQIIPFIKKDK